MLHLTNLIHAEENKIKDYSVKHFFLLMDHCRIKIKVYGILSTKNII